MGSRVEGLSFGFRVRGFRVFGFWGSWTVARSCEQVETIDIRPAPLVTIHAAGNHEHEDPEKRLKLVVLARPWWSMP